MESSSLEQKVGFLTERLSLVENEILQRPVEVQQQKIEYLTERLSLVENVVNEILLKPVDEVKLNAAINGGFRLENSNIENAVDEKLLRDIVSNILKEQGFFHIGQNKLGQNEKMDSKEISSCLDSVEVTRNDSRSRLSYGTNDIALKTLHQTTISDQHRETFDKIEQTIRKERQSYAEGLTIHGTSRIATGHPLNRILWSVLVIASFSIAVLISKEHFDIFLSHKTITHSSFVPQKVMPYPAITICDWNGIARESRHLSGGPPIFPSPKLVDEDVQKCSFNLSECRYNKSTLLNVYKANYDYSDTTLMNHLVEIDNTTNCFSIDGIQTHDTMGVLDITALANRSVNNFWSILQINPSSETFPEASAKVYIAGEGRYEVITRRKITTLLGKPYTDCVQGSGSHSQNIFTVKLYR